MKSKKWIIVLLGVLLLAGCGGQGDTEQAAPQQATSEQVELPALDAAQRATVEKAAAIADAIERAPETMVAVFEQFEMSPEDFEMMLYRIAADPALSAAYQAARTEG